MNPVTPSPSGLSHTQSPGVPIVELIVAAIFLFFGVLSLLKWLRTDFDADSTRDRVLYALHVTCRVGMWFALAGFFVGYALVDEPSNLRWYFLVPLILAGVQFLTGVVLSRADDPGPPQGDVRAGR